MPEDQLSLAAVVVDRFSEPLKRMQTQLRAVTEENIRSGQRTTPIVKAHTQQFLLLRDQVTRLSGEFRTQFEPMLEKVGASALVSAASLGGLAGGVAPGPNGDGMFGAPLM